MGILAERIKGEQLGSVGDSRVETGLSQMEGSEVAQRFHHADAQSFALCSQPLLKPLTLADVEPGQEIASVEGKDAFQPAGGTVGQWGPVAFQGGAQFDGIDPHPRLWVDGDSLAGTEQKGRELLIQARKRGAEVRERLCLRAVIPVELFLNCLLCKLRAYSET